MDELTFLDLAVLQRIDSESVVEKFGQKINSSFFDAANILGSLKIKGYVEIQSNMGSFSPIALTDAGKQVLQMAEEKNDAQVGSLDNAILNVIGEGRREAGRISSELNVRSSDLAFHLYKLAKMGMVDYVVRNAKVELVLTEAGFTKTGLAEAYAKPRAHSGKSEAEELLGEGGSEADELAGAMPLEKPAQAKPSAAPAGPALSELAAGPKKPVEITSSMRMHAKLEYYTQRYLLYIIIALLLIAIGLIGYALKSSGA